MSNITVRRVETKRDFNRFIDFYYDLYRNDEYAVPYLRSDEVSTLSPRKNPAYDFCECNLFLAFRGEEVVGRVAAIINLRANESWNTKAVRFGWFDFVDDQEVSEALISTVEQWGRERGMTEIVGPLSFTDLDREGMMIEGFEELGNISGVHNYAYYPEHMEKMGCWEKDNDYVQFKVTVPETIPDKYHKIAEMIQKRYNLHSKKLTRKELMEQGYGHKIFDILNKVYSGLYGFSQLSDKQVDNFVNTYIKIADLNLVELVVDGNDNDRLVGFGITFPSFARAMQHSHNGRLLPFTWIHLLRALLWHKTEGVDLMLIGVLPEYRRKGAMSIIFNNLIDKYIQYGFKWAETLQMMETNNNILDAWQYLEHRQHKRLRVYKRSL